jgi:hypothetical protein
MAKKDYVDIIIVYGADEIRTEVPEGSSINALIEDGHLRGVNVSNTRLNNAPAKGNDVVKEGDTVRQVPKSGVQG